MKKIIFGLMAAGLLLTSCDPVQSEKDFDQVAVSSTSGLVSFVQTDAEGNSAEDGNYISYTTSPATNVSIYNYASDGSENILAVGASGKFQLKPMRGQSSDQTVYVRVVNSDGNAVESSATLHVYVQEELDPEMKLAVSDSGTKIWKWDTDAPDGCVWGNMGYCGGANDWETTTAGKWWGVTSQDEFLGQLNHSNTGVATGEESMEAYMVWNEDGSILKYDSLGKQIGAAGTFSITEWNSEAEWRKGWLNTSAGAILWPFEINSGGNRPTQFEIVYLTTDKMVLVYPDNGEFDKLGGWGEASFWRFASTSDVEGNLAGYSAAKGDKSYAGKSWTWNTEAPGGAVWGNMGYCGGSGKDFALNGGAKWWGVTSEEEFLGQMNHSNTGVATGEESMDAYMTFSPSGEIKSYNAAGSVIRSGTWSLDTSVASDWKVANLETTAGSILWPFEINSGGNMPTTFEVVYLNNKIMTLVYPDKGEFDKLGGWGEASFWQFKAK